MKKYCFLFLFFISFQLSYAQTVGNLLNTEGSFDGYTLFAPNNNTITYLVDNCGNQVNSWTSDHTPGAVALLLEDGSLLRAARIANSFNSGGSGGRLQLFDWEGNLTWTFDYSTENLQLHHDVTVLENGNILAIAWERHPAEEAALYGWTGIAPDIWSEKIIEIEPLGSDDATIVWEWRLWDHLVQEVDSSLENYSSISDSPQLLDINFLSQNNSPFGLDWLHFNSIDFNPELNQILVSSKNLSEIYIIDHSTTTEEAAGHTGGNSGKGGDILYRWGNPQAYGRGTDTDQKLFGQHQAQWIKEGLQDAGEIMVFNNGFNRPEGNYSTVDIISPPLDTDGNYLLFEMEAYAPAAAFWSYGEEVEDFYSSRLSGAQRLPNGNTLICQGINGRLFEINQNNQIVWEYINPVGQAGPFGQGQNPSNNSLFRGYRFASNYSAFEDRDVTPILPVEGNPSNQNCTIYAETISSISLPLSTEAFIVQNPVYDEIVIQNTMNSVLEVKVVDLHGRIFAQQKSTQTTIVLNTNNYIPGMYIVSIFDKQKERFSTTKIIKL